MQSNKVVIIADDSPGALELMAVVLEREGYAVLPATNGATACRLADENHPDLIVLDLNMPEMDGISAARELRNRPSLNEVAIVALSAGLNDRDFPELRAAGFTTFLCKPVSPVRLRSEVAHLIGSDSC